MGTLPTRASGDSGHITDHNALKDLNNVLDAKGDLPASTAADTWGKVSALGVNGNVLTEDTTTATGWKSAPQSGTDEPIFLGASHLEAVSGTNAVKDRVAGRFIAWLFDATTSKQVETTFMVPAGWVTAHVDYWWSNGGAGAGNVVWNATYSCRLDGEDAAVGDVALPADPVVAAPTLGVVKVTRAATGIAVVGGALSHIRLNRNAAHASDTLANDAALLAIVFTKAS